MPTPTIHTVATAHLDTSWHWTLERTIEEYLPATLTKNFELFEKYPDYTFSFEGAYRYALMEEYYPELFEKLKEYIAQGRWRVAGSAWENGDVNIPSPEALLRNFLLGNRYFEEKFGLRSCEIYLPDCFGFGWALPGIAAHANLKGFVTQKLTWGSASKVPFNLGRWQGPDGGEIFACPDAHNYSSSLKRVRWHLPMRRALHYAKKRKVFPAAYILHGVGDQGGAPKEPSVQAVCGELAKNDKKKVQVLSTGADQIFRDIYALPAAERAMFPVHRGEWLLSDHGTGCYTARNLSKRWNRQAEQLAAAAETSCAFAGFLGRMDYPRDELNAAWKRVIAHQFHDDMTGTSDEISYRRNWDDLMVSQQQFARLYTQGVSAVANAMDTSFAIGRCLAVSNVTQWERRESVQARLPHKLKGSTVRVFDSEGKEIPAQLLADCETFVFAAVLPPLSVSLFDVQLCAIPCGIQTGLMAVPNKLENAFLVAELDENGDIASLYDKRLRRQMLSGPVRMDLFDFDGSPFWPQWELYYPELKKKPAAYPANPKIELLESGPARAAIKITREARGSAFTQIVSLDAAGEYIRVQNDIDWYSLRTLLKIEVPMMAENKLADYDLGFGVARRGESTKRQYEVPAQQWAGIADRGGRFGMAVLSDSKAGWDHPNPWTLRMTGVFSPRRGHRGAAHLVDFGRNSFAFGLYPYAGNACGDACRAGACFGQIPAAFWPAPHSGGPRRLRFGSVGKGILLRALKRSEDGGAWVLRVQEADGVSVPDTKLALGGGITAFEEIYASEEPRPTVNFAHISGGKLRVALNPFEIRSFKLQIDPMDCGEPPVQCHNFPLFTFNSQLLGADVLFCQGQSIPLSAGRELRMAVASLEGDLKAAFRIDGAVYPRTVYSAREAVGAGDLPGLGVGGYVKPAWPVKEFTHLYDEDGGVLVGACARFFEAALPLPGKESLLTLPDDERIILLSAHVRGEPLAAPAGSLFDSPARRPDGAPRALTPKQAKAKESPMRLRSARMGWRNAMSFLRVRRQVDWGRK
ncbi:MAG: glycosyl hydrolase-related protein [Firmicutes bacterium]|nr:glycosyl hydrolase-related protein [Bacillota bacterium]